MVRLRHKVCRYLCSTCSDFHSTMVRLRQDILPREGRVPPYFHSTMVRLRLKRTRAGGAVCGPFPFHNGSIETHICAMQDTHFQLFNFHSTMVRLRPKQDTPKSWWLSYFHSTMVRLRLDCVITSPPYYSLRISIPLWFDWDCEEMGIKFFFKQISIPQWFDWDRLIQTFSICTLSYFHSTMVRLRRAKEIGDEIIKQYFHSTMVRLRQDDGNVRECWRWRISIPQWFDWDLPAWLIEKSICIISIPQWFDWDGKSRDRTTPKGRRFPFHNGSIETQVGQNPQRISLETHFHSTMVRLRLETLFREGRQKVINFHSTMVRLRPIKGEMVKVMFY